MKYICAILLLLLVLPSLCWASPFLTCDPYPPGTDITEFIVEIDGVVSTSDPHVLADGSIVMRHDLAGLTNGLHIIRAKASNIWGASEFSDPFELRSGTPPIPGGYRITN